jgi:glycosyltransferase involved in cell wall biosynthesis
VRVLLVGNHWTAGPGGAETMLVLTAGLLESAGHEVTAYALGEERTLPTPAADLLPRWRKLEARTGWGEAVAGTWSRQAARGLTQLLGRWRPDVAHVHHVHEGLTLSVLDALHRAGVPVVMTLHDYRPVCPNYRLWRDGRPCGECLGGRYLQVVRHGCLEGSRWRSVAGAAEAYVARWRGWYDDVALFLSPSRYLAGQVVAGGLPADRVRVLPNPVEVPESCVPESAPAHAPTHDPGECGAGVAFTGRLVEEKGVRVLLDAAALLPPGVRVRLLGSGRLADEVEERVTRERLPVDLLGPGTPSDAAALLRRSRVAVLPATWPENCPMSLLEAAALGVPVVASAVGGIPELVEDGRTGLLVPPGDAPALATALSRLALDPGLSAAFGRAGREGVRARHDPTRHLVGLLDAYAAATA